MLLQAEYFTGYRLREHCFLLLLTSNLSSTKQVNNLQKPYYPVISSCQNYIKVVYPNYKLKYIINHHVNNVY